jgi:hypothetical protein
MHRAAKIADAIARAVCAGWLVLAACIRARCGAYAYAATPDATWHDLRLAWRCLWG